MNVFGVGLPEMAVIGAVALLVFGPKRLPELGRTLGKTLKGFSPLPRIERKSTKPWLSRNGCVFGCRGISPTFERLSSDG